MTWGTSSNVYAGPASNLRPVGCWQIRTHAALERNAAARVERNAAARGVSSIGDMLTMAAQGRLDGCQTLFRNAPGPLALMHRVKGMS